MFCLLTLILSCNLKKERKMSIYIPKGYVGWVAIVFDDKKSNNVIYDNGQEVICIIKGNPCFFTTKSKQIPEGFYLDHYYYYDDKDTLELVSSGNTCQVTLPSTRSFKNGSNDYIYKSFFVSDTVKDISEIYKEMKKYPDICW